MAMRNRHARRNQQNIGGRVYQMCVLIWRGGESTWHLSPAEFAQRINMYQRSGQRRALFSDSTLLPTTETLRVERIPWAKRIEHERRDSLCRFERVLRPVGYEQNVFLAGLTADR